MEEPILITAKRFEIVSQLGAGGMGVVYEAFDKERQSTVALKTLRRLSPQSLLLFKNEFRALADLTHPNLIELYELFSEDGLWFFSMELLLGQDLLSFVRPRSADAAFGQANTQRLSDTLADGTSLGVGVAQGSSPSSSVVLTSAGFDEARLREAFSQVAAGLVALHAAGKIHRDVKPSNVMVTEDARVVLMDFGLVAEAEQLATEGRPQVMGTPLYMAPEQAAGRGVGPESDWYAVGVMLYQALTDQLPFSGSIAEVLRAKQQGPPKPVEVLNPSAPSELATLAMSLLSLSPAARPTGEEVLARFGSKKDRVEKALSTPFVGRAQELDELQRAFAQSRGGAVAAFVYGESGLGKSALLRKFIEPLPEDAGALVLSGRCYEQESLPYKAFDGAVDALARYLTKIDPMEAALLLPREAALLARLFPVLRATPAMQRVPEPRQILDLFEVRSRAFSALRELFAKLADRAPLVLFIDDLQWADKDSFLLLSDILRPPNTPAMLIVASIRTSEGKAPTVLEKLEGELKHIKLSGLSIAESTGLIRLTTGQTGEAADALVHEAQGHPLFLQEMLRHSQRASTDASVMMRLDEILSARVGRLDAESRQLLTLAAVAGAPLAQGVLAQAAGLAPGVFVEKVSLLRGTHLVKTLGLSSQDLLEPYHDRIRESVLAHLSPELRRSRHRSLAEALEAQAQTPAHLLYQHLAAAGEDARAAVYAKQAAEQAMSASAFEQATTFYQAALRLGSYSEEEQRQLQAKLGEALANDGFTKESAKTFLIAAEKASGAEQLQYRFQAARQFLIGGHVEEGTGEARKVLKELGVRWPESDRQILLSFFWQRLRLKLRGLRWQERPAIEISTDSLLRLDIFTKMTIAIMPTDSIRAWAFHGIALRRALDVGERRYVLRALAVEAPLIAAAGSRTYPKAWQLVEEFRQMAARYQEPEMLAWSAHAAAGVCFFSGRFRDSVRFGFEGETLFRDNVPGSAGEISVARSIRLPCLRDAGELLELARYTPMHLQDAQRRGDRYSETNITRGLNFYWLMRGEPELLRRELERPGWFSTSNNFHHQHWFDLSARSELLLYEDAVSTAALRANFEAMRRSTIFRIQLRRSAALWLWGRLLLSEVQNNAATSLLLEVEPLVRRLFNEKVAYASVYAGLLKAGLCVQKHQTQEAIQALRAALLEAEANEFRFWEALARRRLGELLGGEDGQTLIKQATDWMLSQGIKDPARMAEVYAPGFHCRRPQLT